MTLALDGRQRAMLREMGIRVWGPAAPDQPGEAAAPMPAAALEQSMPPPVDRPARAPHALASAAPAVSPAVAPADARGALEPRPAGIESMDWPALERAVASCRACRLCLGRRNTVFGVGPPLAPDTLAPRADWLVVGEAPGENEDIQGEPFVGQAGKLLDNMLRSIGVGRRGEGAAGACIVNVLKCRPPGNRNPEPEEVAMCEPYLRRQVELLRPKVILAMGRFAVQSLLAETVPDVHKLPLGKLRGKPYQYQGVPVVVTYHPAYLLRSLPDKAKAWADMCLALQAMGRARAAT